MISRQLGADGPEVSALGFGAWPIGGGMGRVDERNAIRAVHAALDSSITLIDTAQAYKVSEHVVGKAIRGRRDKVFLATKVSGSYSRDAIRRAIDASLVALKVDYVDLYQIHGPSSTDPIEDAVDELSRLQRQGKARFIGVSNYDAEQLKTALGVARIQSNQPRYNMLARHIEETDLPFCEERGVGILTHSPLGKGLLTGRYRADHRFPDDDERSRMERFRGGTFRRFVEVTDRLNEVARDKGVTLVQLAIGWQLRLAAVSCVLVGPKSADQVADYSPAVDLRITDDELARIDAILGDAPRY